MSFRLLSKFTWEYESVLRAAALDGWLPALVEAHWTPCTQDEARRLLNSLGDIPVDLMLSFGNRRGRARFNKSKRRYGISLPSFSYCIGGLRAGLVLHEAAHVYDHQQRRRWGHGPEFIQELRELVHTDWRIHVTTSVATRTRLDAIFARHPGRFDVVHYTQKPGKKDGSILDVKVGRTEGLYPGGVVELVREAITADASATLFIWANNRGENAHVGWVNRDNLDHMLGETSDAERVELPDERAEDVQPDDERPAALLRGEGEPVREVADSGRPSLPEQTLRGDRPVRKVPTQTPAQPGTPRKAGAPLTLGKPEGWPASPPAQTVRAFIEGHRASAAEIVTALGPKLNELGVAHPASLVSRLKQAGFLAEATEA